MCDHSCSDSSWFSRCSVLVSRGCVALYMWMMCRAFFRARWRRASRPAVFICPLAHGSSGLQGMMILQGEHA
jgi:hypothetical protein